MSKKIRPVERVDAQVTAPPSKSVTNRALVIAALAAGESRIRDPLEAGDPDLLARALERLGIAVRRVPGTWTVNGCGGSIPSRRAELDAGDAGTTMRFLTALVAAGNGSFRVDGSERMRRRPIGPLVEALRKLGTRVTFMMDDGFPPVQVEASGIGGGSISMAGEISSQFLSAILMVAPLAERDVEVKIRGRLISSPYVDLTIGVMADFGVRVDRNGDESFRVPAGQAYRAREFRIEGDFSSASYFFAAAAVTGGRVRVGNLRKDSRQGDRRFLDILGRMGCRVDHFPGEEAIAVTGAPLRAVEADLRPIPDMAQTLGVVALFARGKTVLRGLANLHLKETDRLAAMASELGKLGALVRVGRDHLEIEPRALSGAEIQTFNDHRMAMSFAVAGLRIPGVTIEDPGCVSKSYPNFWNDFSRLQS